MKHFKSKTLIVAGIAILALVALYIVRIVIEPAAEPRPRELAPVQQPGVWDQADRPKKVEGDEE